MHQTRKGKKSEHEREPSFPVTTHTKSCPYTYEHAESLEFWYEWSVPSIETCYTSTSASVVCSYEGYMYKVAARTFGFRTKSIKYISTEVRATQGDALMFLSGTEMHTNSESSRDMLHHRHMGQNLNPDTCESDSNFHHHITDIPLLHIDFRILRNSHVYTRELWMRRPFLCVMTFIII